MATRFALLLGALAAAVLLPAAALGKEIKSVTITGPGLGQAITFDGEGVQLETGTAIGDLVMQSGFFPELFDTAPDPTLTDRPKGALGPRFRAIYEFPNPETGELARIQQDLYPYAKPYPVTYIPKGREVWKGEEAHGGWYLAQPDLKALLVKAGLPRAAPVVRRSSGSSMGLWAGGVGGAAGLLLALGYVASRRRSTAAE
jgi:hypothetical protein